MCCSTSCCKNTKKSDVNEARFNILELELIAKLDLKVLDLIFI